jgi:hypothetical protein
MWKPGIVVKMYFSGRVGDYTKKKKQTVKSIVIIPNNNFTATPRAFGFELSTNRFGT